MLKGPSMHTATAFEIRFQSLFHEGRALAFPCDSHGVVNLDEMGERARNNYLFARGMIGREFAMPFVQERARDLYDLQHRFELEAALQS
ncbi:hypothetical protein QTH97_34470 [Variovorax sp. J22R24]|uniref:hypothetical protein n=1 Tax=Variovorax gracilis TaxID=3053502 RepID=UPI002575FAAB|nr:hypothetical protein [Variovorax sp. J22R24]MDM0110051.1 hypothetical protein [Variovorax sp. J22R24]